MTAQLRMRPVTETSSSAVESKQSLSSDTENGINVRRRNRANFRLFSDTSASDSEMHTSPLESIFEIHLGRFHSVYLSEQKKNTCKPEA